MASSTRSDPCGTGRRRYNSTRTPTGSTLRVNRWCSLSSEPERPGPDIRSTSEGFGGPWIRPPALALRALRHRKPARIYAPQFRLHTLCLVHAEATPSHRRTRSGAAEHATRGSNNDRPIRLEHATKGRSRSAHPPAVPQPRSPTRSCEFFSTASSRPSPRTAAAPAPRPGGRDLPALSDLRSFENFRVMSEAGGPADLNGGSQ